MKDRIHPLIKIGSLTGSLLLGCQVNNIEPQTKFVADIGERSRITQSHNPPEEKIVNLKELNSQKIANFASETSFNEAKTANNFENWTEARIFIESEVGAQWLLGNPSEEVETFPWNSPETWEMFSGLNSVGNQPHFVFLIPHTDNQQFSVMGIENIEGETIISYIGQDHNSKTIVIQENVQIKELLDNGYGYEKLFEGSTTVWPSLNYPIGNEDNCSPRFQEKVTGATSGFACSEDNKRGFYFQSQNLAPKNLN